VEFFINTKTQLATYINEETDVPNKKNFKKKKKKKFKKKKKKIVQKNKEKTSKYEIN